MKIIKYEDIGQFDDPKVADLLIPMLQISVPLMMLEFQKMGRPWYIDVVNACASFWTIPHNFFFRDSFKEKTNSMSAREFETLTFCLAVLAFSNKEYGVTFCGLKFIGTPPIEFSPEEMSSFASDVEFRKDKLKILAQLDNKKDPYF